MEEREIGISSLTSPNLLSTGLTTLRQLQIFKANFLKRLSLLKSPKSHFNTTIPK